MTMFPSLAGPLISYTENKVYLSYREKHVAERYQISNVLTALILML